MTQQINLLESSLRPRRQWLRGRDMLVAGALLAGAVLAHYQFERLALAAAMQAAASNAPLPADVLAADESGETSGLQQRQARLQRDELLLASVSALSDLPRDSAQRIKSVIATLPAQVWLKEVELRGANGMRIAGGTLDAAGLAEFVRRLGDEPAFQGLPLHLFAVEPRAAEEALAPAAQAVSGVKAGAVPAHYGFVLSSVDPSSQSTGAAVPPGIAAAASVPLTAGKERP
jgi:hypothetical protein